MLFLNRRNRLGMAPLVAWPVTLALLTTSCAHALEVKNIDLYKSAFINSQQTNMRVGLIGVTSTPDEERLLTAAANALKRDGFKVDYPFHASEENKKAVDYVVKVSASSEYKGSGWNFLINWPGFLIWTPAWHGYNYQAIYGFDVDITDTKTGEALPRLSIPVDLDLRHADMNRTWTELSWLEWSLIAFIGGLIFTRYDKSVTPLLVNAIETRIGDYTSSKIAATLISAKIEPSQR